MPLLYVRAVVPFEAGANATDVLINEVHFNRTALNYYHYTLFSNGTLSNGTDCYLAFNQFQPHMNENGTFVNGTSCYAPIRDMGRHASAGLAFAFMFVFAIVFTLINMRKHSRRYLPADRRWTLLGRRAKWIWMLFIAACGTISCFMSIDVDRGYIVSVPLILQSVFYTLLTPGMMAAVWEAVRHWGSWQERQIYDRDPYAFQVSSSRQGQEFVLPLVFYGCALANFVLTVPRSWTAIEMQRSLDQQLNEAKPVATDVRWRAAGFVAIAGVLVICYSLEHSIYRYRARPTSTIGQLLFYLNAAPSQFLIGIVLLGIKIGYAIASAFDWTISPLRYGVDSGWFYGLGYTPVLLLLILFNICGFCELNEDKALIVQRDEFDHAVADAVGVGQRKPSWWKKSRTFVRELSDHHRRQGSQQDDRDMGRFVEMGIIKPREQPQDDEPKPETWVTTRTASQGSESTTVAHTESNPESSPPYVEYTLQQELSRDSSNETDTTIRVWITQRQRSEQRKYAAGPSLPPTSEDDSSKRRKVIGPAPPPPSASADANTSDNNSSDDDSDDDFGPSLPPPEGTVSSIPDSGATQPARSETTPEAPKAPQRDAWMLEPIDGSNRNSRVDPTKLRNRKFQTGRGANTTPSAGGLDVSWTETPEQKMKRLQDEVLGVQTRPTAPDAGDSAGGARGAQPSRAMQEKIHRYNEEKRKEEAKARDAERKKKKDGEEEEDDPSARAFDKEKDMSLSSKITHAQRREMMNKAADFGSRFTSVGDDWRPDAAQLLYANGRFGQTHRPEQPTITCCSISRLMVPRKGPVMPSQLVAAAR
ncbi:hypothetical protein BO79DRAFT_228414 [Aspergillus costaricaensis CBS 115574]|uniref:Uncharacterized protein n=1 Tax=Aspergillus costaricaensis CBS 115574 TaxID=1448317 RepID=A0ACD1IEJ3_9EURO|nr:hypothetical protein BO79DRAFT_228414 [Aspergillus costaricaensis CBS 115574]RAK88956.1 hypothetical protein BO79DRAFT_228414 [Aspergillus costaricaensis CBS 115574]